MTAVPTWEIMDGMQMPEYHLETTSFYHANLKTVNSKAARDGTEEKEM